MKTVQICFAVAFAIVSIASQAEARFYDAGTGRLTNVSAFIYGNDGGGLYRAAYTGYEASQ